MDLDGLRGCAVPAYASVIITSCVQSLAHCPPIILVLVQLVPGYKSLLNLDRSELSRYRLQAHPSNLHAHQSVLLLFWCFFLPADWEFPPPRAVAKGDSLLRANKDTKLLLPAAVSLSHPVVYMLGSRVAPLG